MKLRPQVKIFLFFAFFIVLFSLCPNVYDKFKSVSVSVGKKVQTEVKNITTELKNKELEKRAYDACLAKAYNEDELSSELIDKITELDNYIKNNYNISVKYEDITTGFNYYYKPNEMYYAASTIKLLDALYIYAKAANKELDLKTTITYKQSDVISDSKGMKQHKVGDKISLRLLVKYAIIYSDNSAHQMLISYIGFNNLKEFGNELGATSTLVGGDNFGYINANDAIIYLKYAYNFINNNSVLGSELKGFMIEAEENGIKYDGLNLDVAHKYGFYKNYYNDIAIIYDNKPYLLAILTLHGNDDYFNITFDISKRINEIHNMFKENRSNSCKKN